MEIDLTTINDRALADIVFSRLELLNEAFHACEVNGLDVEVWIDNNADGEPSRVGVCLARVYEVAPAPAPHTPTDAQVSTPFLKDQIGEPS